MVPVKPAVGLQIIFSIFLGLMVTAFIGVGVYTFYPSPQKQFSRELVELNRQETAIRNSKAPDSLTAADRARLQQNRVETDRLQDAVQVAREAWGLNTSIILIAFATLVMAVSMVRTEQLPVISNGLLLGGVFVMIYGVGWIIATETSVTRFVVISVALLITLGLGYVRFVRRRILVEDVKSVQAVGGEALAGIAQRLAALEQRLDDTAAVLGRKHDPSG